MLKIKSDGKILIENEIIGEIVKDELVNLTYVVANDAYKNLFLIDHWNDQDVMFLSNDELVKEWFYLNQVQFPKDINL